MKDEKCDDSSIESTVDDHCVKETDRTNDGAAVLVGLPMASSVDVHQSEQQQLVETGHQPDHLLQRQQSNDKSSANGTDLMGDDNGCLSSSTTVLVQPSLVDATTPLILKYSRESEEKPSDVQSHVINQHYYDMKADELTCEFCGAVINPDFTPVHNKNHHTNSSDSEEVNNI